VVDPSKLGFAPKVLLDFTSPAGFVATHVRAGLVAGLLDLLRETKNDERFLALLPERLSSLVRHSMASTWIEAGDVEAMLDALDRTFELTSGPDKLGEALGERIANSMFSALLRTFRAAGSDGVLLAVRQADRMWPRIYQGGGLVITQTGPKDLHLEIFGLSFARARTFRVIHGAFVRGMLLTLVRTCVVRSAPVRTMHAGAYAIEVRWV
jgi:hypothetical protein